MRLNISSDYVMLDEFDKVVHVPPKKVFISNMTQLDQSHIPASFAGTIYTSQNFVLQLRTYFSLRGTNPELAGEAHYQILTPNVPCKIQLNKNETVTVYMFEADDCSKNILFAFKHGNECIMYAGNCNNIRSFVDNRRFNNLIRQGVQKLCANFENADDEDNTLQNESLEFIRNLKLYFPEHKIILSVPRFGFESLICELGNHFPSQVYVAGTYEAVLVSLNKFERKLFLSDPRRARICISQKNYSMEGMKRDHKNKKFTFVKVLSHIHEIYEEVDDGGAYYKMRWTARPNATELYKLIRLVRPTQLYTIESVWSAKRPFLIPADIVKLCIDAEKKRAMGMLAEVKNEEDLTHDDLTLRMSEFFENFGTAKENADTLMPTPMQMAAFQRQRTEEWVSRHKSYLDFPPDPVEEPVEEVPENPEMLVYKRGFQRPINEDTLFIDIPTIEYVDDDDDDD